MFLAKWGRAELAKAVVLVIGLAPAALLLWEGLTDQLGPDPAKLLVDETGLWAIRFLFLSLAMTPLRHVTGFSLWMRYRRMLGLFALFYVFLHVTSYVFLLFGSQWSQLATELVRRPYILVGSLALLLMVPLGITSTKGWQRRLGRRWSSLHRLVYPVSLLALLHFAWVNKLGILVVWPYALVLALMLGLRLWWFFQRSVTKAPFSR